MVISALPTALPDTGPIGLGRAGEPGLLWFGMSNADPSVNRHLANPWLAGAPPKGRLSRPHLEERILNLLSTQNMCVVATTGPDGPLATPVRYYHDGFTLVFTAQNDSPKVPEHRRILGSVRVVNEEPNADDRRTVGEGHCVAVHMRAGRSAGRPPATPRGLR